MEKEIIRQLEEKGIAYEVAKPGEDKSDIITKNFDIEIETGLKKDLAKFKEKLANSMKKTYAVVPSEVEKVRYGKATNTTTLTLAEFII